MQHHRQRAIDALRHAEARNVLALAIAREIIAKPDAARVPSLVIDFLCGPWSQVIAQARIVSGVRSALAQKFRSLVSALLWSVHPDLAHKDTAKLTRLIPLLLGTLRVVADRPVLEGALDAVAQLALKNSVNSTS